MEYYQQTGVAKSESVAEYIIETYFYADAPPVKLLIFAHHRVVMDAIAAALEMTVSRLAASALADNFHLGNKIYSHRRLDVESRSSRTNGKISKRRKHPSRASQHHSRRRWHHADSRKQGYIRRAPLESGRKHSFAHARRSPIASRLQSLTQAEDRAHRLGQKDSVLVIYILARETADDRIWPLINAKLQILQAVDLNDETFSSLDNTTRIVDDRPKITDYFEVLEKGSLDCKAIA